MAEVKSVSEVIKSPEPVKEKPKAKRVTHKDMGDPDSEFTMSQGYPIGE